ncbi:FAD-dependent oxidoreductase [candidate division FCPU426 bacterium]|nr:FAD-dependent oxidoreductase [candidate division FCPU426 bacterium]
MDMSLDFKLPQEAHLDLHSAPDTIYDVCILGGGPAGLTAAIYAARKQLDTVLISPNLGGQVLSTSGIENYMGFQFIQGAELAVKFSEQIGRFPLKIAQQQQATKVEKRDEKFAVYTDADQSLWCRAVIIATGKRWKNLNIPGEEQYRGRGVSYCSVCDGPFFKGKPVLVAGGGNSALTAAVDMLGLGSQVSVVNISPQWQADEVLLAQVQGRAELYAGHALREIHGDGGKVTGATLVPVKGGPEKTLAVAGVFIEIGLVPNTEVFKTVVDLNMAGEVNVNCMCQTSQPGIFAAGDCTNVPDKQIIIAAGEGAKAALSAYRFLKNIPADNPSCR